MPVSLRAIRPKRLKLLNPEVTKAEARKGIREYLTKVKNELNKGYSDVTPSPNYTRTNRLKRGWKISVPSHNYGTLTNDATSDKGRPYAVYVVGPFGGGRTNLEKLTGVGIAQQQARTMRRKGWRSINDVARETSKDFAEITNRSIGPHASDLV